MGQPIDRSAAGLREALFDAIDGLRSGTLEVQEANAISKTADVIIRSIQMQIEFEQLRLESKVPGVLPPMNLAPRLAGPKSD